MIFYREDAKSLTAIAELLKDYGNFSGQHCNPSKSLIYAGGMSNSRHSSLANLIGFTMANLLFIYLGLQIFVGKPKACYFMYIEDNIRLKLNAWKGIALSMAGRTQLMKSVILSMIEIWIKNFVSSGNMEKRSLSPLLRKPAAGK
ncbi:uncharacterized protein LOC131651414 [Vicia villosa]|uniref:uncharacterized protein LOC131651414 n=1 Tax=Vicia villosa TaxID=3911 RepID=UPI00273B2110|nr:uncharacterized protein LOC131651414 [Vicia villosa]